MHFFKTKNTERLQELHNIIIILAYPNIQSFKKKKSSIHCPDRAVNLVTITTTITYGDMDIIKRR